MRLLAILTGPRSAPACLDAAILAARAFPDAEVDAVHVLVDPEHMVASPEEIDAQRLREAREGSAADRAARVRDAFAAWQDGGGGAARWRTLTGPEEETVRRAAGEADVVALSLGLGSTVDAADAFHAGLFETGRPVIVVPPARRRGARTGFAHIAIALSGSEQARHAIAGAAPWLRAAARATVIRIGADDDAALALAQLVGEGAAAAPELRVAPRRHDVDLGAQVVAEANAVGADLLVAGAYRHARAVEWLLGGTTRQMLAAANLPILLAH